MKNSNAYSEYYEFRLIYINYDRFVSLVDYIGEVWTDHPVFTKYQVSDMGRVKAKAGQKRHYRGGFSQTKERIIKPSLLSTGYLGVTLYNHRGKPSTHHLHVLVAEAFLGHVRDGMRVKVMHNSDNRFDNRMANITANVTRKNGMSRVNCTSPYIGVYAEGDRWRAQISPPGSKERWKLGMFDDEVTASEHYQIALDLIERGCRVACGEDASPGEFRAVVHNIFRNFVSQD